MKKRFFVFVLCLAMALGMFAAAENMDAQANQYTFYVDGAEYMSDALLPEVREKGLSALLLQGPAAEDAASAQEALKEERAFSVGRIGEITEALFPTDMSPAQEAQGAAMPLAAAPSLRSGGPASLDGTTIEKVEVRWMTADTIENNDADLLYLKPPADDSMSVKYQLSYALSGEHDYAPGDLTITIPGRIFRDRNGKLIGGLTIPYAENPSMKTEFNWMQVGEDYVLTNTRRMSAATKGYIQFLISGITPHVVADMSVTDDLTAKVEVVTHEGNVLSLESNAITAQVDAQAKVNIATKRASSVWESVSLAGTRFFTLLSISRSRCLCCWC